MYSKHHKTTIREVLLALSGLVWIAAAITIVALGQHDRIAAAALAFIPLIGATKIALKIVDLQEADKQFRKRHAERRADRPPTLCDLKNDLSRDRRPAIHSRHPRGPRGSK